MAVTESELAGSFSRIGEDASDKEVLSKCKSCGNGNAFTYPTCFAVYSCVGSNVLWCFLRVTKRLVNATFCSQHSKLVLGAVLDGVGVVGVAITAPLAQAM